MKTLKKIKLSFLGLTFSGIIWLLGLPAAAFAANNDDQYCQKVNDSTQLQKCVQNNQIIKDLQTIINALSIGVAVIVVAMIIVGGIQYMTAGDSPEAITKAKQRILNAVLALVAFVLIFAFLQWLIPGGIFA